MSNTVSVADVMRGLETLENWTDVFARALENLDPPNGLDGLRQARGHLRRSREELAMWIDEMVDVGTPLRGIPPMIPEGDCIFSEPTKGK